MLRVQCSGSWIPAAFLANDPGSPWVGTVWILAGHSCSLGLAEFRASLPSEQGLSAGFLRAPKSPWFFCTLVLFPEGGLTVFQVLPSNHGPGVYIDAEISYKKQRMD